MNALTRRSKSAHSSTSPVSSPSTSPVVQPVSGTLTSNTRVVHKPSPLSLSKNNVVASPTSSSPKSPSSHTSRSPIVAAESSSTSPLMSPLSLGQASTALSPPSPSIPLPNRDMPPAQITASVSGPSDNSGPPSPLKYRPRHILRHSRSSVLSSRQSGARDTSPSRSSVRPSAESDRSYHSDARSIASPGPYSATPMTHSLKAKLSLPALKIKGNDRAINPDQPSPTLSTLSATPSEPDKPRVQIKDVDFELVKPSVQQLAVIDEDLPSPIPLSPIHLEAASLRASSPAFSTISGVSSRTMPPRGQQLSPPPRVVSEAQPSGQHDVEAHRQRELRWISIISSVPASQARKNKKVRKLLWEGVPASVRYLVWAHLTDSKSKRIDNIYYKLTQRDRVPASASIERDLARVFPNDHQLHDGSLLNILQAYLTMVPDIHYSRGEFWDARLFMS